MKEYRMSRKNFIGSYICAVLLCWTIIVPIAIIIHTEIKVRGTKYIVDKDSVTYKFKFLSIQEKKISKKDITDISLTQGLIQRLLNVGDLHINTAGSNMIESIWTGIEDPEKVREEIK